MTALAEAERVVRGARRRIAAGLAVAGAFRGAFAGAAAGLVAAVALQSLSGRAAPGLLAAAPLAGAVAGMLVSLRRTPDLDRAALVLDRAARTDEGFVSALAAREASLPFRELAASWALRKCGAGAVAAALPVEMPKVAAAAVLACAALAAVVLVPRTAETPRAPSGAPIDLSAGAVAGPADTSATPHARVGAVAAALRAGDEPAAAVVEAARTDLASVPSEDLRALAEALAAGGSEEARRAAEALARGDVAGAVEALRAALGGVPARGGATLPGGSAPGAAAGADGGPVRPRTPANWPLRYDRTVQRWLDLREVSK